MADVSGSAHSSLAGSPTPYLFQQVYSYAEWAYAAVERFHPFDGDYDELSETLDRAIEKLARPHKVTILHDLISATAWPGIEQMAYDTCDEPEVLAEARDVLTAAGMKIPTWLTRRRVGNHRGELFKLWCEAVDLAIVPAAFYLLFSDRAFLMKFQQRVASHVQRLKVKDHPGIFQRKGKLRRAIPPSWLVRGVYYRDRGICTACGRDVSGIANPNWKGHLDHIIPLALSGSNDPTNFQLLCEGCNREKSATAPTDLPTFVPYWT